MRLAVLKLKGNAANVVISLFSKGNGVFQLLKDVEEKQSDLDVSVTIFSHHFCKTWLSETKIYKAKYIKFDFSC